MKDVQRVPLYMQVRDYVYDQINRGNWKPNDRLPSEKELSEQFNVSRITVKKALSELTDMGMVYRIQGRGSFVSSDQEGEPTLYKSLTNLQTGYCVAFLIPRLENTYTANLVKGIEQACRAAGMNMILAITNDSQEEEKRLINEMIQIGVNGIIIFPVDGEGYNEQIVKLTMSNYPLVLIDRYFRGIETNNVCTDNVTGAYDATNHLLQLGHRNVGVVSTYPKWTTSIEDRIEGYERALSDAQIPINRQYRLDHFNPEAMNVVLREGVIVPEIKKEIQHYLRTNAEMTAVFATNIAVGLSIIAAAEEIGIRVPDDLSIVYYDFEPLSLLLSKQTYMTQDVPVMVHKAVELLMAVISDPQRKRERVLIPSKLVKGNTTSAIIHKDQSPIG